jgi:exopolyphosphatase/pppGpp-phosphohydrolase
MDVSVIELGTREFHLLHARAHPGGRLEVSTEASERVGIDASVDTTGHIGRRTWGDALRGFGRLVAAAGRWTESGELLAIAPDGLGAAANGASFLHAARLKHGVGVEALSAAQSAHLVYAGVRDELRVTDGDEPILVAHLGDASLELVAARGGESLDHGSVALGVARVGRAYDADRGLRPEDAGALFSLVRLSGGPAGRRLAGLAEGGRLVVTSCRARAVREVARAWGYLEPEGDVIGRLALHALVPEILGASRASLCRLGIGADNAVLVGTTAVLVDALADLLGRREVHFAGSGVRHGAAIRWLRGAAREASPGAAADPFRPLRQAAGAEFPVRHRPFTGRQHGRG